MKNLQTLQGTSEEKSKRYQVEKIYWPISKNKNQKMGENEEMGKIKKSNQTMSQ